MRLQECSASDERDPNPIIEEMVRRIAERFQKGTGRRAGQRDFRKRRTVSWLP